MSLTVARLTLNDPQAWSQNGKSLSLSGQVTPSGSTTAEKTAELMQLYFNINNLVDNPDEDIYPVTWSLESRLDGYYYVRSASVSPIDLALSQGYAEWSLELEQIPGFANPTFETTYTTLIRSNVLSVSSGTAILTGFLGDSSLDYSFSDSTVATVYKLAELGNLHTHYVSVSTPTLGYVRNAQDPDYYYRAACMLEVQLNGTWYPWIGRQLPSGLGGKWRISNGLIKWAPNATIGDCDLSIWDTSAYVSTTFRPIEYSGSQYDYKFACGTATGGSWTEPTVVRNDPEQVTLRFDGMYGHSQYHTIRRGCSHMEYTTVGFLPYGGSAAPRPGLKVTSAIAATSMSFGGLRRTSNDANGNRWVMACHALMTKDVVNGSMYTTNVNTTATFAIGMEFGGSASSGIETAASLVDQFYAPVSSKTMVVTR